MNRAGRSGRVVRFRPCTESRRILAPAPIMVLVPPIWSLAREIFDESTKGRQYRNLEYFHTYMSNGIPFNGPGGRQ